MRDDLKSKVDTLASKHLGAGPWDIKDCSGMSNPVFIIDNKLVIRFFESSAADFHLENKIFAVASEKGLAPGFIESDGKTYRIEKCFEGKPFTCDELRNEEVLERTIPLIRNFNYDLDLLKLQNSQTLKSLEFV